MPTPTYFTVSCDLFATDTGDEIPLIGDVTFSPMFNGVAKALNLSPRPAAFHFRQEAGYFDVDGRLRTSRGGAFNVRLPANDPTFNLPTLLYRMDCRLTTPEGEPVDIPPTYIPAPETDTAVSIVQYMRAPEAVAFAARIKAYAEDIINSGEAGRQVVAASTVADLWELLGETPATGDVFNWKASNTRKLDRSLARVLSGAGAADHLIIGDSESGIYTGTPNFPAMWPRKMGQFLNARGVQLGGTGWVHTGNDPTIPQKDPRFTLVGTWLDVNSSGYLYNSTTNATMTFASDQPGTAVSVAYYNHSAGFTVSIDGDVPVTVTPPGATQALSFYTVTGLADTVHTVVITAPTVNAIIMAVQVYRATGLRIHNAAISGGKASWWATAGFVNRAWITNRLGITPDVIHIALGVNDINADNRSANALAADITTIRNYWSSADVILYGQYAPSPAAGVTYPPSNATWAAWIERLYALATTLDCPLIDLYQRSGGSYAAALAAGLMGDTIHPNEDAQADCGLLVANMILGGGR